MSKELTPKQALKNISEVFISSNNEVEILKKALDQKAEQEKEISALGKLCENQDKLIERRESELRGYREVIEGNFEINITEEATPDKLNECISDLIKANEKQQRILDILKNRLCLELHSDYLCLKSHKGQEADYTILFFDTEEEYDLLKEWLKND